jgi:hypothetical protein
MNIEPFWKFSGKGAVTIDEGLLVNFLSEIGFASYYQTDNLTVEPVYLYKDKWIVEPIISTRIHTETIRAIQNGIINEDLLPRELRKDLIAKLISSKTLTKKEVLACLPELEKPVITDTAYEARFFYNNGIVTVTGDRISLTDSDINDCYVWKSRLMNRKFTPCPLEELDESEYGLFLKNISGSKVDCLFQHNQERFKSLMSLIGYMLHSYKDCSNPRSLILMDASLSDEPRGRTGKGLLVKGLGKLHKVSIQDGKTFDTRNRFRFSDVDADVDIVLIDDVPKDFNFELFFSLITEGITIEAKYANKYFIPFEKSPKIVITTNYTVKGIGSSHEARKYEYELSNYYSEKFTPKDEFGHLLFTDWSTTDWMHFDNLNMQCVKYYLKNGVYIPASYDVDYKKFVSSTSHDFAEWIESKTLGIDTRYFKSELYADYSQFCEGQPEIKNNEMNRYLRSYAKYKGLKFKDDHVGNRRYVEFNR